MIDLIIWSHDPSLNSYLKQERKKKNMKGNERKLYKKNSGTRYHEY